MLYVSLVVITKKYLEKMRKIEKYVITNINESQRNTAREKQQITHKGIPIRITADLSLQTYLK